MNWQVLKVFMPRAAKEAESGLDAHSTRTGAGGPAYSTSGGTARIHRAGPTDGPFGHPGPIRSQAQDIPVLGRAAATGIRKRVLSDNMFLDEIGSVRGRSWACQHCCHVESSHDEK